MMTLRLSRRIEVEREASSAGKVNSIQCLMLSRSNKSHICHTLLTLVICQLEKQTESRMMRFSPFHLHLEKLHQTKWHKLNAQWLTMLMQVELTPQMMVSDEAKIYHEKWTAWLNSVLFPSPTPAICMKPLKPLIKRKRSAPTRDRSHRTSWPSQINQQTSP